ncbi:MAG: signal peptidase I, partial [Bifidobacteriaceae bacterium]|nr:signal peptidase I [Bifidobacteriaceae bacterium]
MTSQPTKSGSLGTYFAALAGVLIMAVLALAIAAAAVPMVAGGEALNVKNSSMAPTINVGDLAVTRSVGDPSAIRTGQIVVFRDVSDQAGLVIRRVVDERQGTSGRLLTVQGDASSSADKLSLPQDDVIGVYMYRIPRLGYAVGWAEQHGLTVIIILSALVVLLTVSVLVLALRQRRLTQPGAPGGKDGPAGGPAPAVPRAEPAPQGRGDPAERAPTGGARGAEEPSGQDRPGGPQPPERPRDRPRPARPRIASRRPGLTQGAGPGTLAGGGDGAEPTALGRRRS